MRYLRNSPRSTPPPRFSVTDPILVSACLLGVACRYDGKSKPSPKVISFLEGKTYIAVCPEEAGGLPTPRPPCVLTGGDGQDVIGGSAVLVDSEGADRTAAYIAGAHAALAHAENAGATMAILKEKSPSCGTHRITVEKGSGPEETRGMGVTAALLASHGVLVISDEEM
ncbi:MAG: DUF523 domain-containing protein [Deltaproteobacteria bacterium]|nr:DUF523 domain-containing protein [Candidatus Zymogenaceae bacterium]